VAFRDSNGDRHARAHYHLSGSQGTDAGTYNGTITLHVPGVPNSTTVVPVTYTIQTAPLLPTITANGVVNNANLSGAIAPGTWVSIFGASLSSTTRPWATPDSWAASSRSRSTALASPSTEKPPPSPT